MGKNHRHKKDIKAQKGKTKLKQTKTKFLPKGLNVTDTSFKIKPIVLVQQLKEKAADDILSRRKLNVKDLLRRLKHYNDTVRCTACLELTQMIKVLTDETIYHHLSQICLEVSMLMQDRENRVRKAAVKSVEAIVNNVTNENLTPFFDIFSTNLRCAMTNIDVRIQEDSLLFLDCFLTRDCGLIAQTSEKLLPDFLALISKLRNDSEIGRTLTLNLGGKLTSVDWRIKVLSRLHAIFAIILEKQAAAAAVVRGPTVHIDEHPYFPLYNDALMRKLESRTFFKEPFSSHDPKKINRHIITLVPLLYETWLEARPERKVSEETSVLTQEVGSLLTCITNTLHLLWRYVKAKENDDVNLNTVFLGPEGRKFLRQLLNNFPYSYAGRQAKQSKSSLRILQQNNNPQCVRENLLICFLFLMLHVNCLQQNLQKEMTVIGPYLKKILLQKSNLKDENIHCLLDLLAECFGQDYRKWQRSGVGLQTLLVDVVEFYKRDKICSENTKVRLIQILAAIVDNVHLSKAAEYQNWLFTLPDILCQPSVHEATVDVLLKLSPKNCRPFQAAIHQKMPEILGNLDNIRITACEDEETAKRNLTYNIFYYIPSFSTEETRMLHQFIESSTTRTGEYMKNVLLLRLQARNKYRSY